MKNAERVAQGLLIFVKYDPDADCSAEREVIYANLSHKGLSAITDEDRIQLKMLGWLYDKDRDFWYRII